MSRTFTTLASALLLTTATAVTGVAVGQAPRLTNGQVTTQPGAGLAHAFRTAVIAQAGTGWVGYSVPMVAGERSMCCFDSGTTFINGTVRNGQPCCGMCSIEPSDGTTTSRTPAAPQAASAIKLEGPDAMVVLFRVVNRQVERIRVFSEDCALDAGGRQVTWLTGVRPPESVALLESLIAAQPGTDRRDRVTDGAITAIALHEDSVRQPPAFEQADFSILCTGETVTRISDDGEKARRLIAKFSVSSFDRRRQTSHLRSIRAQCVEPLQTAGRVTSHDCSP